MTLNRRDFLKISGAGVAAALTGCATQPSASATRAHVVVVGVGFGGATARGDETNFTYMESWSKNIWANVLS